MKKTFLGVGFVLSFLCLLASCGSAVNDNNNDNGPSKPDTTKEKVKLYKSFVGEYEGEYETASVTIAENYFTIDGTRISLDPEKDLYYYNELPAGNFFEDKYEWDNSGYGNSIKSVHLQQVVGQDDKDTVTLNDWITKYYYDEYMEDERYKNSSYYTLEEERPEWYQKDASDFYDYENDVYYTKETERKKYSLHVSCGLLFYYDKETSKVLALAYKYENSEPKFSSIVFFEAVPKTIECKITKINSFKDNRLKLITDEEEWAELTDKDGKRYNILHPYYPYADLDELVAEAFAEEIEDSGLSARDWRDAHRYEWDEKSEEIEASYRQQETTITETYTYNDVEQKWTYLKKKGSGNSGSSDDDDDDDDNGSGSSGSIDASDFEGITWKYAHENVSSTTTQNVVFKNGTVTVTTITKSNNSSTTNKNREETASYELDGDKITITYSKGGYEMAADYTISVDGSTLSLEGDENDTDDISLLMTLFQNTSGTASMTFTK